MFWYTLSAPALETSRSSFFIFIPQDFLSTKNFPESTPRTKLSALNANHKKLYTLLDRADMAPQTPQISARRSSRLAGTPAPHNPHDYAPITPSNESRMGNQTWRGSRSSITASSNQNAAGSSVQYAILL